MSAEVTAKLGLDVTGFRRALTGADKEMDSLQGKLRRTGSALATAFAPAAKAVVAIGAAATVAGGVGAAVFGRWIGQGLALNSQLEQASTTFKVFTGDAKAAKEIVDALRAEADATPFDTAAMVDAGKALISSAKGSREELMKLIKTAEVLAALGPEQGLGGAAFSLREAMGGDYQSLIERFNISRGLVKQLKAEGKEGLDLVNAAIKEMGAGPELVNQLANTFEGRKSTVLAFFDEMKRAAAAPVFDVVSQGFEEFSKALTGDRGQKAQELAKSLGADLGESARTIKDALMGVDWKSTISSAGSFAKSLSEAAVAAAQVAAKLPHLNEKAREIADSTGMNATRNFFAKLLGLGGAVADASGNRKTAAFAQQGSLSLFNSSYAQQQALATTARQEEEAKRALQAAEAKRTGPIGKRDLIENWLRSRNKSAADLMNGGAGTAVLASLVDTFGPDAAIGDIAGPAALTKAQNFARYRAVQSLQKVPAGRVNISLIEMAQKHSVMTTLS